MAQQLNSFRTKGYKPYIKNMNDFFPYRSLCYNLPAAAQFVDTNLKRTPNKD